MRPDADAVLLAELEEQLARQRRASLDQALAEGWLTPADVTAKLAEGSRESSCEPPL